MESGVVSRESWIVSYLGRLLPQLASVNSNMGDEIMINPPIFDHLSAVHHASNIALALTATSPSTNWPTHLPLPPKAEAEPTAAAEEEQEKEEEEDGLCGRKVVKKRKTSPPPPPLPSSPSSSSTSESHLLLGSKRVRACHRRRSRRRSQLQTLRSLVPGGQELNDVLVLLDEAGDYIQCLQMQVQALQALTNAIEGMAPPNL